MKRNLILIFSAFVLILSYQNCAEDFDINQYSGASVDPGPTGQTTQEDPFELDMSLMRTSVPQESKVEAVINLSFETRPVSVAWEKQCPEDNQPSAAALGSCESHLSCMEFSCLQKGSAYVIAKVFHQNEMKQEIRKRISITDIEQVTADPSIQILSSSPNEKQDFLARIDFPKSMSAEDQAEASINWSIPTGCTSNSLTQTTIRLNCSKAGNYSLGVSYDSRRYVGSAQKTFGVNGRISFITGVPRVGSKINIGISHNFSNYSNIAWSTSSPDCRFSNVVKSGSGYTGELLCTKVPSNNSGKVRVQGLISTQTYEVRGESALMTVLKGSLSVSILNAPSTTFLNKSIKLNASVAKNNAGSLNYNWKMNSNSGCIISGRNTLEATITCSSTGTKVATFEASNDGYRGIKSVSFTVLSDPLAKLNSCSWSSYSTYDNVISYTCPANKVMTGVKSVYSTSKHDRMYSYQCCSAKVGNTSLSVTNKWYSGTNYYRYITSYDSTVNLNCSGNKVRFASYSKHSNSKEDRIFGFGCASVKLGAKELKVKNCEAKPSITGYANSFKASKTFTCPTNKVLTKEYSYHLNSFEDRRFRYTCCELRNE